MEHVSSHPDQIGPVLDTNNTPTPSIPVSRFATSLLARHEVSQIWHETMSSVFESALPADGPGEFQADLTIWHLGDLLVSRTFIGEQSFSRSLAKARRDDLDHYLVQFYCDGGYEGQAAGNDFRVKAGDVSIIDLARATHTHALASHTTTLVVPRHLIATQSKDLHGLVLRGACGKLLADHLQALTQRLPGSTLSEAPAISSGTVNMISAMLAPTVDNLEMASETVADTLRERAKNYIERQLTTPNLSPDSIGKAIGISRPTLYRIFENYGGVASFIMSRRLEHVRRQLRDPTERRRIGELSEAVGFRDSVSFIRAFKRVYSMTPRDYREASTRNLTLLRLAGAESTDGMPRFDVWINSLKQGVRTL